MTFRFKKLKTKNPNKKQTRCKKGKSFAGRPKAGMKKCNTRRSLASFNTIDATLKQGSKQSELGRAMSERVSRFLRPPHVYLVSSLQKGINFAEFGDEYNVYTKTFKQAVKEFDYFVEAHPEGGAAISKVIIVDDEENEPKLLSEIIHINDEHKIYLENKIKQNNEKIMKDKIRLDELYKSKEKMTKKEKKELKIIEKESQILEHEIKKDTVTLEAYRMLEPKLPMNSVDQVYNGKLWIYIDTDDDDKISLKEPSLSDVLDNDDSNIRVLDFSKK